MKNIFLFILLLFSYSFPQNVNIESYRLKNGMKVILGEDHRVPSICVNIFFNVGGKYEKPGTTGISHLFEHMMFNGSKKYKPGYFDQFLEENGGYSNGSTWNDFTNYWEEFNSEKLEEILAMEADRVRSLKLDNENLEQERYIVMEERRLSVDNNPDQKLEEELYALAFNSHPYQNPVIGWMNDLKQIQLDDCKEFYKSYYAPNNATLIIIGDFNKQTTKKLIEKYFSKLPSSKIPINKTIVEPEQSGEKQIIIDANTELPSILIGYKSCSINDSDYYAMDLLANILSVGESSRFNKILVNQKEMITKHYCIQDITQEPGLFKVYFKLQKKVKEEDLLNEFEKIIQDIKENGVTQNELEKAKNFKVIEYFNNFKTNRKLAFALGFFEVLTGNYENLYKTIDRYSKVDSEKIKEVARKYFTNKSRTIAKTQIKSN